VPSISAFDGDVQSYHRFIRSFDASISPSLPDDDSRLAYLANSSTGEPRRLIEDCVLCPSVDRYLRARSLLQSRYGREQDIVDMLFTGITSGPCVKANNAKALDDYGLELERRRLNLDDVAEATTPATLRKLAHRLLLHLQSRW
jgi:hypothetical protein